MPNLVEYMKIVNGLSPIDVDTAPTTEDYVSMKNYGHCTVILTLGVTGSACTITLKQASDVAATGEKALGFSWVWVNAAVGTDDILVKTAVTSNTFDTSTADGLMYVMEIDAETLDVSGGFDCMRIDVGASTGATIASCVYVLSEPRYAQATPPTAVVD